MATLQRQLENQQRRTAIAELKARQQMAEGFVASRTNLRFDADRRGRLRTRPRGRGGSADSHRPYRTLENIRVDCADARANNPIIRGMVHRLATNIGEEFRCDPDTPDTEFNKRARDAFMAWADDHEACHVRRLFNLEDQSRIAVEEWCWAGGMGVLKTHGLRLQEIEIARLRNEGNAPNDETHVNGWELTGAGEPVAVHIADWERDGSYLSTSTQRRPARQFMYLPNMLHIAAGQRVTEPAIAASLRKLEILDKFIMDSSHAATFAASVALMTKTGDPRAMDSAFQSLIDADADNLKADGNSGGPETLLFESSGLWNMRTGEEVEQIKPEHPGPMFDAFIVMMARIIGSDLGLPYELAILDFSKANFHSMRSGNSVAWRAFAQSQRQLARRLWQPTYGWFVANAIRNWQAERTGVPALAPPNVENWEAIFHRCKWSNRGQPVLDPEREMKANALAVDKRLKSWQQAIRDTGGDPDVTFEQLREDLDFMRQTGIEPEATPGSVDPKQAEQDRDQVEA